jgi:hypothetical protein
MLIGVCRRETVCEALSDRLSNGRDGPMTEQERRRATYVFDAWEVEYEDLSKPGRPLYRAIQRDREPDPRLTKATTNAARPMRTIKHARCGVDGRIVGRLEDTSEGVLWIGFVIEEQELRANPTFLDELSAPVVPECRIHGRREIAADDIKNWAKTQDSNDLFV